MNTTCARRGALALLLLSAPALAQWSSDPAVNLAVRDVASDQNQAKVVATPDGGAWVSWFDGQASSWDVRVQKLDAAGNEVFAHGGLLVADRGFSSTQDYGLDVDVNGDALLAFRDDRVGGTQITATKVTAAGTFPWGATGVQLTSTTAFVAAPKICGTSDGGAVVAWTQDFDSRVQKLDAAGAPQWTMDVVLSPGGGSYSVSDLHDAGTDAVLSFVHQTGGFGSPRHILAQKLDASGALLWGAGHVSVFDGGSLQFGNFPSFVPDGGGGGVFAWYSSSPSLQCFAQRLDTNGTELFGHNGVTVSTNAAQIRVDPSAAYDAGTGDTYVFWREQNTTQSMNGVSGQRLDAAGNRLWGASGVTVVPVGSTTTGSVRTIQGTGALVVWAEIPSNGQDRFFSAHLDAAGTIDAGPSDVASTPSGKARLAAAKSTLGFAILAWSDARNDGGDIYAQNVNLDTTLGGGPSYPDLCNGDGGDQLGCTDCPCANNAPAGTIGGCLNSSGAGARLSATGDASVSLPPGATADLRFALDGAPAGAFCILNSGDAVAPTNTANPCFGQDSGAQSVSFDGLRCAVQNTQRHGGRPADAAGTVGTTTSPWGGEGGPPAGLAVAFGGFSAGQTRFWQVIHRDDPVLVCMRGLNTSQAIRVTFTP